jgi:hypothetical protein
LRAREPLHALHDRDIALQFDARAHARQFRHMGEAIEIDRVLDHAGPLANRADRDHLRLHVGREARERTRHHAHRARPRRAGNGHRIGRPPDHATRFFQLAERRFEVVGHDVLQPDRPAGHRGNGGKRRRLDAVGDDRGIDRAQR